MSSFATFVSYRTMLFWSINRAYDLCCNPEIPKIDNFQTSYHDDIVNPQMPKVFRQPKTPKGVDATPWIFAFPSEFFENISRGYVFGVKESNGDNEKILSLLHDLENQGQTPFCMTFFISGCKHDTKLILASILTFSRSRISKGMLKKITWPWRLDLGTQGHTHSLCDLS